MSKLFNLARMTTATTGTGPITLGSAVSGFLTFGNAGAADGDVVSYAIRDGANSEIGTGTYNTAGTTLTRTTILRSTNSNTAITLSGNAQVFITPNATDLTPAGLGAAASGANSDITSLTGLTGAISGTTSVMVGTTISSPVAKLTVNNNSSATPVAPQSGAIGQFIGADAAIARFQVDGYGNRSQFQGGRINGTAATPSGGLAVTDVIFILGAAGWDGIGAAGLTTGAFISMIAAENWDATHHGTYITFTTNRLASGISLIEAMRIQPSGGLSIGSTTDPGTGCLLVAGSLTLGTALAVLQGGTGATTASGARSSLGAAASGANTDINSLAAVTVSSTVGITDALFPILDLKNTGAGTDNKIWRVYTDTTHINFDTLNDARTVSGGAWLQATRSGNSVTSVTITPPLTLGTALAVLQGGTGATTAAGALTNLGAAPIASPTFTGNVGRSVTDTIAAAGTTQAGATAITSDLNIVTSGTGGVRLPTAVVGMDITIRNNLGVSVNVYPATGASINALAANSSVAIGTVNTSRFIATTTTQWRTA